MSEIEWVRCTDTPGAWELNSPTSCNFSWVADVMPQNRAKNEWCASVHFAGVCTRQFDFKNAESARNWCEDKLQQSLKNMFDDLCATAGPWNEFRGVR